MVTITLFKYEQVKDTLECESFVLSHNGALYVNFSDGTKKIIKPNEFDFFGGLGK